MQGRKADLVFTDPPYNVRIDGNVCGLGSVTRSLADFAKIVERLDAKQASFVSVTQAFNTTTSMGRLSARRCCGSTPLRLPIGLIAS